MYLSNYEFYLIFFCLIFFYLIFFCLIFLYLIFFYLIFTRCKKQESLPGGRLFEYADIRTCSTFPNGGHLLYVLNIFYRDFHLNFKNNHPWATSQIFNLIYFLNINQLIIRSFHEFRPKTLLFLDS